jgi:hypothetical protein
MLNYFMTMATILFSLPVNYLNDLRDFGLDKGGVYPFPPKYRLSSIICDVASFRLFILESKSLKVSCNVLGLEAFLTFGC